MVKVVSWAAIAIAFFASNLKVMAKNAEVALDKQITFYSEVYPPANYIENGELKGITVDTLKALWQHLDIPEQDISVVPWSRGYRFTLTDENTALFTMSRTHSREHLFKWVGPVFNSTHVLMAKKNKGLSFKKLGEIFYHKVAAVRGDISEIALMQVGFPESNMAKVSELKQAYLMLEAGRVDMMVVTIHGFSYLSRQLGFNAGDYHAIWEVNKVGNYIAFNVDTPDDVISQYQQAFIAISQQRLTIKEMYQLPEEEY